MISPSLITPTARHRSGGDQACGLRSLAARRAMSTGNVESTNHQCHTIVVAGGKGGVGRSVIALNLAITFAKRGDAVGLLDASPDFGNIELLCGLNGYWNLAHVAQGSRQLTDVMLSGPAEVNVISGASCLSNLTAVPTAVPNTMLNQLLSFERKLDWLIIDASGGSSSLTREIASAADDLLIVTTPEPTAVAEAYASVKSFTTSERPRLGLLVNQAESAPQALQILDRLRQAAQSFLQVDLHRRGFIPRDSAVPASVNSRIPFAIESPQSSAARSLLQLAQTWTRPHRPNRDEGFFSRIQIMRREIQSDNKE